MPSNFRDLSVEDDLIALLHDKLSFGLDLATKVSELIQSQALSIRKAKCYLPIHFELPEDMTQEERVIIPEELVDEPGEETRKYILGALPSLRNGIVIFEDWSTSEAPVHEYDGADCSWLYSEHSIFPYCLAGNATLETIRTVMRRALAYNTLGFVLELDSLDVIAERTKLKQEELQLLAKRTRMIITDCFDQDAWLVYYVSPR